jgi:hypothetical protein
MLFRSGLFAICSRDCSQNNEPPSGRIRNTHDLTVCGAGAESLTGAGALNSESSSQPFDFAFTRAVTVLLTARQGAEFRHGSFRYASCEIACANWDCR